MEDADWIDGCMVRPSLRPAKDHRKWARVLYIETK